MPRCFPSRAGARTVRDRARCVFEEGSRSAGMIAPLGLGGESKATRGEGTRITPGAPHQEDLQTSATGHVLNLPRCRVPGVEEQACFFLGESKTPNRQRTDSKKSHMNPGGAVASAAPSVMERGRAGRWRKMSMARGFEAARRSALYGERLGVANERADCYHEPDACRRWRWWCAAASCV